MARGKKKKTGPGGVRKGAGRPPIDNPRSVRRELRLLPEEEAAQVAAAERAGLTWSAWALEAFELALARGSTR